MTYWYEELLEMENRAAYHLNEREKLLDVGDPENEADDVPLKHRKGRVLSDSKCVDQRRKKRFRMDGWMKVRTDSRTF